MLGFVVVVLGLLQLCSSASSVKRWADFAEKHSWSQVPHGWDLVGPAPPDYVLSMHIALKQARFDELEQILLEVSDPLHDKYAFRPYCLMDQIHNGMPNVGMVNI
jgi:tripeptidyl-peptidase-1